jgi:hypothetical protein
MGAPIMPLHNLVLPTLVVIVVAIVWSVISFLLGTGDVGARALLQ